MSPLAGDEGFAFVDESPKVPGNALWAFPFESSLQTIQKDRPKGQSLCMAGDEGFEPPIPGPEPGALPLGQSPLLKL